MNHSTSEPLRALVKGEFFNGLNENLIFALGIVQVIGYVLVTALTLSVLYQGVKQVFRFLTQPRNLVIVGLVALIVFFVTAANYAYYNRVDLIVGMRSIKFLFFLALDEYFYVFLSLFMAGVTWIGILAHLKHTYIERHVLYGVTPNAEHFPQSLWAALSIKQRLRAMGARFQKCKNGYLTIKNREGFVLGQPIPVVRPKDKARSGSIGVVDACKKSKSYDHFGFVTRLDFPNKTKDHSWIVTAWHVIEKLAVVHATEKVKIVVYANCKAYIDVTDYVIKEYMRKRDFMSTNRHNDSVIMSIPTLLVDRAGLPKVGLCHSPLVEGVRTEMLLIDPLQGQTMSISGNVLGSDGVVFKHNTNTEPGYSGAGVLVKSLDAYYFAGVHCGERIRTTDGATTTTNYGADYTRFADLLRVAPNLQQETPVMFQKDRFEWLARQTEQEMKEQYEHGNEADLTDLGDFAAEIKFHKHDRRGVARQLDYSYIPDQEYDAKREEQRLWSDWEDEIENRLLGEERGADKPEHGDAADDLPALELIDSRDEIVHLIDTLRNENKLLRDLLSAGFETIRTTLTAYKPGAAPDNLVNMQDISERLARTAELDGQLVSAHDKLSARLSNIEASVADANRKADTRLVEVKKVVEAFNSNLKKSSNPKAPAPAMRA